MIRKEVMDANGGYFPFCLTPEEVAYLYSKETGEE
jgi:hypothetical protein